MPPFGLNPSVKLYCTPVWPPFWGEVMMNPRESKMILIEMSTPHSYATSIHNIGLSCTVWPWYTTRQTGKCRTIRIGRLLPTGSSWWRRTRLWCKGCCGLRGGRSILWICWLWYFPRKSGKKYFLALKFAAAPVTICSQPEVANGVISGYNLETFRDYAANLWVAKVSTVFQKIEISHLCNALTTVRTLGPISGYEAQMSNDLHNS